MSGEFIIPAELQAQLFAQQMQPNLERFQNPQERIDIGELEIRGDIRMVAHMDDMARLAAILRQQPSEEFPTLEPGFTK